MKKKRRKIRYSFLVFFCVLFFGGGIALYVYGQTTTTTTTATNTVTVGKVDVELAMATHNAGVIVPGETAISNTVTVENVGNYPAYIRMFVKKHWEITEKNATLTPEQIADKYAELSVDAIDIQLKEGWNKGENSSSYQGYECYYYNKVVDVTANGVDAICFSDSYQLKVEETEGDGGITNELLLKFTKNGAKVDGYYSVIVEAIQADTCIPILDENVTDKIIGWNDTPSTFAPVSTVSIDPSATPAGVVNFTSENTEITDADSFITVDSLLPGKTEERVVEIKNTSDSMLPVYVYAESAEQWDNLKEEEKEWLEQLQLVIGKEDGTVLYQDSLYKPNSDEPMLSENNPILIDNFSPNTSQKLYVSISCPASWTKGDVRVKVNWIFASKKALSTKKPSNPSNIGTNVPSVTEEPVIETDIPETTFEPVTDVPEETPMVTTDPTDSTNTPIISEMPSETGVVVTESPLDGDKTLAPDVELPTTQPPDTQLPDTQPPASEMPAITDDNVITPEPSSDTGGLTSEGPNTSVPSSSPKVSNPSSDVPNKTSTPKQPTKVEELYPTKTGDVTPIVVWLALFVVSCIGMISVAIVWRRQR